MIAAACALFLLAAPAAADTPAASAATATPPDEGVLGSFVITGVNTSERLPKIAVLPSLSPDYEDVIVRGVVRRDFELTGLYELIPDSKAPAGLYGFEDPIDVEAWQKVGAEAIVKVSAQKKGSDQIQVGIPGATSVGKATECATKPARLFFFDWEPNLISREFIVGDRLAGQHRRRGI